jgi:hypothetical protein
MGAGKYIIILFCTLLVFSCRKKIIEVLPAPDLTWKHFDTDDFKGTEAIMRNLNTNDSSLWVSSNRYLGRFGIQGNRIEVLDNLEPLGDPNYETTASNNFYGFVTTIYGNASGLINIWDLRGTQIDFFLKIPLIWIDSSFYKVDIKKQNGVFSSQDVFLTNFASTKDSHPHLVFIRMNKNYYTDSRKAFTMTEENSSHLNVIRAVNDYFLISAQGGTYKADSSGSYHKVSSNSFIDFFTYHDTCFADRGDWIYYSADKGESWQIYAQYSQIFPGRKFFIVNDKVYFFSQDKIYAIKNFPSFIFAPVDNTHLEGDIITSMIQFGQRVYAGTNNGVYYKNVTEF